MSHPLDGLTIYSAIFAALTCEPSKQITLCATCSNGPYIHCGGLSLWGIWTFVQTWFLRPTWVRPPAGSQSVQSFLHSSPVSPTQTDTETTLHATSVAVGRIYALRACSAY